MELEHHHIVRLSRSLIRRIEQRIMAGYAFVANVLYYRELGYSFRTAVALARNTL